ncbi:MAG TPA: trimethylamine methyltransferase family protein [Candidatus Krumholzibacteriaceae bacterium]|nr:trimethylamine methyltransferase family protein [Candidatus Krumholzibacteriaceae bacterium]
MKRPTRINWLEDADIERIVGKAIAILDETGVYIENDDVLSIVRGAGIGTCDSRAFIPEDVVRSSVESAPERVTVYDRLGKPAMDIGGRGLNFNPGSSAVQILRRGSNRMEVPDSVDLVRFARLTDFLEAYDAQSTALVPGDVPEAIADRYRLYLALKFSPKPVVTGTFSLDGFEPMRDMLRAVAGGEKELRAGPIAIFDCCPTSPLLWSDLTAGNLADCARAGIPAQIVPMPLAGATSPVTLAGTITQQCAENLSGIVINQIVAPGAPVIYGGSPACFDMRKGTTPMGAVETQIINGAAAQIAEYLGLPSHAYMALSDSNAVDYQAGMETAMSAVIASASGVNNVSGPGMHNFQRCQSMEKLVLDNEVCMMAKRLREGIRIDGTGNAKEIIEEGIRKKTFLSLENTLKFYREAIYYPDSVIDRTVGDSECDVSEGDIIERAAERVKGILKSHRPVPLEEEKSGAIEEIMMREAEKSGMGKLPELPD